METILFSYNIVIPLVLAFIVYLICKKVIVISQSLDIRGKFPFLFCVFIIGWYTLSFLLSINGFFHSSNKYSKSDLSRFILFIGIMLVFIAAFFLLYWRNKSLKKIISVIDIKFLINLQIFRICGTYFIFLTLANKAPSLFALPPGIFDLIVGMSALAVSWVVEKKTRFSVIIVKIWNYIGLIDFATAFAIYFLYFPFRVLQAPASQVLIVGFFPIAFIIMLAVPLWVVLHILTLIKLRNLNMLFKSS